MFEYKIMSIRLLGTVWRETYREKDREADRRADTQIDRQISRNREACKQTETQRNAGLGGSVVGAVRCVRKVAGSNPTLAAM